MNLDGKNSTTNNIYMYMYKQAVATVHVNIQGCPQEKKVER